MTRAALALAIVAAAAAASADVAARPLRVMSINTCGDQLLLALLPPDQITSVTWLSRDPSSSIMARAAAKVPVNHGAAEEVLRDRPDLVIAGAFSTPATRQLIKKVGIPLIELTPASNFDDVRGQTRQVAAAVGARAQGEVLIARMDAILRRLAAEAAPSLRVAAWDGGGFGAEPGSMYDAILRTAGARNVAAELTGSASQAPGVEMLLATAPALLVEGQPGLEPPGLRANVFNHPLVRRYWRDRIVTLPAFYYACGTPFSAAGAWELRANLKSAAAHASGPLPFAPGRRP
jgi:iron complex transport system substrate-binding protein